MPDSSSFTQTYSEQGQQGRPFDQLLAGCPGLAHRPLIQRDPQFPDRGVPCREAEENAIAETGQIGVTSTYQGPHLFEQPGPVQTRVLKTQSDEESLEEVLRLVFSFYYLRGGFPLEFFAPGSPRIDDQGSARSSGPGFFHRFLLSGRTPRFRRKVATRCGGEPTTGCAVAAECLRPLGVQARACSSRAVWPPTINYAWPPNATRPANTCPEDRFSSRSAETFKERAS